MRMLLLMGLLAGMLGCSSRPAGRSGICGVGMREWQMSSYWFDDVMRLAHLTAIP
jgi:hypothetical protein